ncbi:MAG TPA: hypothetical protein VGZ50_00835 [Actinomycetota bacterium]|nr:hypothetical protein [Actinomycetota bacterium]
MVVDVRLAEVLLLLVLVTFVVVGHRRMVVLVSVGGHQVRDVFPVTEVVSHVAVLVVVDRSIV